MFQPQIFDYFKKITAAMPLEPEPVDNVDDVDVSGDEYGENEGVEENVFWLKMTEEEADGFAL